MVRWWGASALVLGVCLTWGATGAEAQPRRKAAASAPRDARDDRIDALEAQVQGLIAEVRGMKDQQAQVLAHAAAAPAQVAPARAGATVIDNAPSTPDSSRPVVSAVPAPTGAGGATMVAGKPSIASPDGRFQANLHGVVQFDAGTYFQAQARPPSLDFRRGAAAGDTAHARDLNDGTDFRRARIGIDGKVYGDFEYNVLFEFGGAGAEDAGHVQEAWLQYSGFKPFHLRIGAFRPSLGLEDQGSTNGMPFLERPAVTDVTASLAGADFREGAQLWAAGERWFASGLVTSRSVGTINSTGSSNAQAFDTGLGFIGRLAYIPFKGDNWLTHIGVHGSYAAQVADAGGPDVAAGAARYPIQFRERPELRVDGTRLVDTGAIDAVHGYTRGFEIAAQKQNVFIQAEYESFGIERRNSTLSNPDFSGWYVEGSWILTGERRRYNPATFAFDAPTVDHPFDLANGTWGALELAARYSDLNLNYHKGDVLRATPADGARGGEQKIFSASTIWYLNPVIRFLLEYQHVDIDRLSPSPTTYATPVGAFIGQKYSSFAIRSQLAF